nr:MAG TPA: hypothetical protein [Caudoviricetes sp.]
MMCSQTIPRPNYLFIMKLGKVIALNNLQC